MARGSLKEACGNNSVRMMSSRRHISGSMRINEVFHPTLPHHTAYILQSKYIAKKVHSLTKCLILCILLWPNIFTYNENVSQQGTFSCCINCACTLKNNETMRSEKYSLSSKGHFIHLNHIPAFKSKPVWDPWLRLSISEAFVFEGTCGFYSIFHINLLYINSIFILNSDILFCCHSNDKPFSPTRHSPFILTTSVYHNVSFFKKKKDKNN